MTNQEKIEQAEKAIDFHKRVIDEYNQLITKETISKIAAEAKLSDLKKQSEPKEGEWWYFDNRAVKGVVRYKKNINDGTIGYSEGYFEDHSDTDSCCDNCLKHIANTEEITYFMGLHAERLGIKDGVTVDKSELSSSQIVWMNDIDKITGSHGHNFARNCFQYNGVLVRDENGTWATVVTEKPKNGKLKAKIAELEERIQKAKDILDGK